MNMKSFIGILCGRCHAYFRIYKDASGRLYQGRCPKCLRVARALINRRKGTNRRFFVYR
jgi:hypothetical protein